LIRAVQKKWVLGKSIKAAAGEFSLSAATAKKYIDMTEAEIAKLDAPANYKKRATVMDGYLNIIYKMLRDEIKPAIIMAYVIKKGYAGNWDTLEDYIKRLAKNNFNLRVARNFAYNFEYPDDVVVIKRNDILKYITTKNPKVIKNEDISQNFEAITQKHPTVMALKNMYDCFYDAVMGNNPENIDDFIMKCKNSTLEGFADGLAKDIIPVKNSISYDESNGFVEGNNNKFKLIKRILYGRANFNTLFKKSYIAFKTNLDDFQLSSLIKKMPRRETSYL
jgi:transposase